MKLGVTFPTAAIGNDPREALKPVVRRYSLPAPDAWPSLLDDLLFEPVDLGIVMLPSTLAYAGRSLATPSFDLQLRSLTNAGLSTRCEPTGFWRRLSISRHRRTGDHDDAQRARCVWPPWPHSSQQATGGSPPSTRRTPPARRDRSVPALEIHWDRSEPPSAAFVRLYARIFADLAVATERERSVTEPEDKQP